MNKKILITSLGWEERFILSSDEIISKESPDVILLFKPINFFKELCEKHEKSLNFSALSSGATVVTKDINTSQHVDMWLSTIMALETISETDEVILDLTTMPRYLIWACLHGLETRKKKFTCIYYPPNSYGEWLSADTGKPQMVFRHSGVAFPDRPTCLLLFSGFDLSRAQHFVDFFEPKETILLIQGGDQLNNQSRCISELRGCASIASHKIDSYSDPYALSSQLIEILSSRHEEYNVVATTVGPRPSSVALYLTNRQQPMMGLVHANAHQYNPDYSSGINLSGKYQSTIDFTSQH